ncbi:hypothetical protein E5843_09910 [Luteimonas yindakuii]|nr:hypothetical protein E5843_09910 [Luteimonas yindakuii]
MGSAPRACRGRARRRDRRSSSAPHPPFGHLLPQTGEGKNTAMRQLADAVASLLPLAGEGGATRRMRAHAHPNHPCSIQPSRSPARVNAHARWPSDVCTT